MFLLTCAAKVASTGRVLARAHVQQNDLVRAKIRGFFPNSAKTENRRKLSKTPVFEYGIIRDPKQPQKAPGASTKRQRTNRTGGRSVKPVSLFLIGRGEYKPKWHKSQCCGHKCTRVRCARIKNVKGGVCFGGRAMRLMSGRGVGECGSGRLSYGGA